MDRPDIYIGLVGAAGTDLDPVKKQLRAQFLAIGYKWEEIKVSKLISSFTQKSLKGVTEDKRIKYLMAAGDNIREAVKNGDGVTSLISTEILKRRALGNKDVERIGFKGSTLFVIDSLKNPAEIVALDQCYARNYYTISVYAPENNRRDRLSKLIASGMRQAVSEKHHELASDIMKLDEGQKPVKLSQDVLGTFPKADFFVESSKNVTEQIQRFVELVFGNPFITPTHDEHFMNLARTASLRSADLSRQVGAVIVDDRGAVISQGYNEVPYPGGGVFYEGRPDCADNRDFINSKDPNQAEITEVLKDLIGTLRTLKLLDNESAKDDDEAIAYELLQGKWSNQTADARIRNLIEFGRIVHAEMAAICEAARFGRSIDSATLYCTTFPCHGCARHIIASGIREVVFIEPYPKSLTTTLYGGEIRTDGSNTTLPSAVIFRPFQGVSPILFRRVFIFKARKNADGSVKIWDGNTAVPVRAVTRVLHYQREVELRARIKNIEDNFKDPPLGL